MRSPAPASHDVPAVILAAGLGSRLNQTRPSPKCLTPVGGRALICWIVDALAGAGIQTAWAILGNEAGQVEDAIPTLGLAIDVRTTRCPDWELGNGRTAAHAERVIGSAGRFLLLMSDHLISTTHVGMTLRSGLATGSNCVLATASPATPGIDPVDATKVRINPNGRVTGIGKNLTDFDGIDTGVFSMSPIVFAALAQAFRTGDYSLTGGNRVLIAQELLMACPIGDLRWQDVDTPTDLRSAEEFTRSLPVR
jgi:choline kinase